MAYNDRHVWSAEFDGSSTGDKAYFGGFTTRVQIHRIGAYILDATTGAGTIDFDKRTGSTDTADGVGQLTVSASQSAGNVLTETPTAPVILSIGSVCVVAVDDAFDALAIASIEYSILEQSLDMTTVDATA